MRDIKKITIMELNGERHDCSIQVADIAPWILCFNLGGNPPLEFEGECIYDSFQKLRLYLEQSGYQLLCNGARRDAILSGMSRQMSSGRLIYIGVIGEAIKKESMVDIFDYAEPELVGSMEQQRDFYKRWVEALQNG